MEKIKFTAYGAEVTGYLHEAYEQMHYHLVRPAIVICPGGAYAFLCNREADPPALHFFGKGYNVFILRYSVGAEAGEYRPIRQLAEAVSTVRKNSEKWHIHPDRIAVMGFSAGGHLAASLGVLWHRSDITLQDDCKPNAMVLCYPVLSLGEYAHEESARNVSGGNTEMRQQLSLELHVSSKTAPAFIWHAINDPGVPIESTMLMASALKRNNVPFECHMFETGEHGKSICNQESDSPAPHCAPWVSLCATWLGEKFEFVD